MSQRPALGCLFEVVETLVLTLVIFLGIQTFVAQPYKVQQTSMETTLLPDQYVLVDKLTPHWSPYVRGDIVVFDPPTSFSAGNGVPFIKRIIGLPGDTVELRDGKVFVNGTELNEPYIFQDDGVPQTTDPLPGGASQWLVPAGDLLVMGDHRHDSSDSRTFGPIEISHVIGRAWLRYWPFDTFGILPTPQHPELSPSPMNLALAAVALAVGAGSVIAVSVRDLRAALIGLAVALVGSALLVDPLPGPATLGVRIVGGLLVVAILRTSLPDPRAPIESGSTFGWPAETLIAAAAALGGIGVAVGLAGAGTQGGDGGPAATAATLSSGIVVAALAVALFTIGAAPAVLGRSGARRAIGLVLMAQAAVLLLGGLAGTPGDFGEVAIVVLLLGCAATGAVLTREADHPTDALEDGA